MTTTSEIDLSCELCDEKAKFMCQPCLLIGKRIKYCSAEHQKDDWKHHKKVCGKPSEELTTKLHLFGLPAPLLITAFESLEFYEVVRLVDLIMLSNKKGRRIWHAQIKGNLRCPDMDNRRYSKKSLQWVLKRGIAIRNFRTRELEGGDTELVLACCDDEAWLVRACLACNDDDINAPDEDGYTPLHYACNSARVDVVKLLLESGAQPSLYYKIKHDTIPIEVAIQQEKVDVVKLLLSYHVKDKAMALEKLGKAFILAAQIQMLEIVKLFVGAWPDIIHSRWRLGSKTTALHETCIKSDDTEVMEFLLASGAKLNAVDDKGQTALYFTCFGRPECTKVLLAAGTQEFDGEGGIGSLDGVVIFGPRPPAPPGAAVNHVDGQGRTPLDYCFGIVDPFHPSFPSDDEIISKKNRAKVIELLWAAGGLRAAQLPVL